MVVIVRTYTVGLYDKISPEPVKGACFYSF